MKKMIIYFILGIVVICNAFTFDKTYGGANEEHGFCVKQANDGGYILAGSTQSSGAGGHDGWLIKTDINGEIEWEDVSGETLDDYFMSVEQTSDDGFIVLGYQNADLNVYGDCWLIKYDKRGKEKWSKIYQRPDTTFVGKDLKITSDDGVIIVGSRIVGGGSPDIWMMKTDSDGNEEWSCTFDGGMDDYGNSIVVDSLGSSTIAGTIQKTVIPDGFVVPVIVEHMWVLKVNSSGQFLKDIIIGDNNSISSYYCNSIQNTFDTGYILTGSISSDLVLIKLDSNLVVEWNKEFGSGGLESGRCVKEMADQSYVVSGDTNSYGTDNFDIWLLKTDSNGNELWSRTYGGSGDDQVGSFDITFENEFIIIGSKHSSISSYDLYLIKTDELGNVIYPPEITYFENDSNNVTLDWDVVSNAGSYVIYGSDRPDSNFTAIDTTTVNTWNTTTADSTFKKFYYIKSNTESIGK